MSKLFSANKILPSLLKGPDSEVIIGTSEYSLGKARGTTSDKGSFEIVNMNWKTVYIVGKGKFHDDVVRHIDRSGLEVMSGYHSKQSNEDHELFWIPESMTMREFKEGIGAKTIFKHRLRFFESLEQFIETINSSEFTEDEKRRMDRMRRMDSKAHAA